jgi:hypothetical protein
MDVIMAYRPAIEGAASHNSQVIRVGPLVPSDRLLLCRQWSEQPRVHVLRKPAEE